MSCHRIYQILHLYKEILKVEEVGEEKWKYSMDSVGRPNDSWSPLGEEIEEEHKTSAAWIFDSSVDTWLLNWIDWSPKRGEISYIAHLADRLWTPPTELRKSQGRKLLDYTSYLYK